MPQKRKGARIPKETVIVLTEEHVLQQYRRMGAFRDKNEEVILHQFFSPRRIPYPLVAEQVRECITLFPLKQWFQRRHTAHAPTSLIQGRPLPMEMMSQHSFDDGVRKFKAEVAMLLMSDLAGITLPGDCKTMTITEQMEQRLRPLLIASDFGKKSSQKLPPPGFSRTTFKSASGKRLGGVERLG